MLSRRRAIQTLLRLHGCSFPSGSRALSTSRIVLKNDHDKVDDEIKKISEKMGKEFEDSLKNGANEQEIDKKFMNFRQLSKQKSHERSHIFTWKTVLGTFIVGGSMLLALFYIRKVRVEEAEKQRKLTAGKARIGGDWELQNTEGKMEGSEQLKGNWLLLYFGFTHCPDICPDEIEKMVKVVDQLERDKDPVKILPIFISVDPARDTLKRVKEYCLEFSPKLRGYSGTPEQVKAVAKTFRVYHSEGPKTAPDDYIVDHTVIMYLIDPEGNFHDYYGQNRRAEEIAQTIRLKVLKAEMKEKRSNSIF
ncbi:hypothetical protein PENTCL1PPCAC_6788 [Pristionchus entomophagus]|uniref:Thioredoxin domain-containing protein n=1 Tax=Pristionchus entomophagus TaxID=358040 RepID=A0AAV5SVG3_9BILA|nr:hypothetical protein PENTCL1PPCAC_6788 [Pristionchus entomophagus]